MLSRSSLYLEKMLDPLPKIYLYPFYVQEVASLSSQRVLPQQSRLAAAAAKLRSGLLARTGTALPLRVRESQRLARVRLFESGAT